jgi:DNA-binding NarL/FixJ family response regulator
MHRPRLLLADDHALFTELMCDLLEKEYEIVATARDGESALTSILSLKPDVAVLDISMPVMSGIEVTARLQRLNNPTPIVLVTVHQDIDLVGTALDAGAMGYVVKARARTDLLPAVSSALAGRPFVSPRLRVDNPDGPPEHGSDG